MRSIIEDVEADDDKDEGFEERRTAGRGGAASTAFCFDCTECDVSLRCVAVAARVSTISEELGAFDSESATARFNSGDIRPVRVLEVRLITPRGAPAATEPADEEGLDPPAEAEVGILYWVSFCIDCNALAIASGGDALADLLAENMMCCLVSADDDWTLDDD